VLFIKLKPLSFNQLIESAGDGPVLLAFWAEWHPPSKQMLTVVDELAKEHQDVKFVKIEAEQYPEVTQNYPVKSVPTFVFLKQRKAVANLEGANPPDLVALVKQHSAGVSAAASDQKQGSGFATAGPTTTPPQDLNARLSKLVNTAPVMLFMKGSPDAPRCGFSRQMVELLKSSNASFEHFDILTDEEVRQGLKEYSKWPTYPQLYINGKLVGGLDIVKELNASGELASMLPTKSSAESPLHQRLRQLINQQHAMLFMKGTPEQPRCGFSAKIVQTLRSVGAEFGSFNILEDNEVREGLKTFSNWPTYPQLYVDGKLIGGVDVVEEMAAQGELTPLFQH
jgi:Grx4 family monothiol glutaredoxin